MAVIYLYSGIDVTVETVMSSSKSTKGMPFTVPDIILVQIFVFIHVFVIGFVIELMRGKRMVEYDCEFGLPTDIDYLLCHEEAAALLANPVSNEPLPAYVEAVLDELPTYRDVVGTNLALFVVETDDEQDDTW